MSLILFNLRCPAVVRPTEFWAICELIEQHFVSIMLELLRMEGKRDGGIRRN
jgi:hypothetical protein